MADLYGFCIAHANDIPLTSDRWCPEHQTLCLPPSWSPKDAVWPEWPPRPADYVYAPRQIQAPVKPPEKAPRPLAASRKPAPARATDAQPRKRKPFMPAPSHPALPTRQRVRHTRTVRCEHCQAEAPSTAHGGAPQRYCSGRCRNAAQTLRKQNHRAVERQRQRACGNCSATFTPPNRGGSIQRYCSVECRGQAGNRLKWTRPMSAQGRVCAGCGRDDRPHKARGLCSSCWKRDARTRSKQASEVAA